jgi:hypothetical protein
MLASNTEFMDNEALSTKHDFSKMQQRRIQAFPATTYSKTQDIELSESSTICTDISNYFCVFRSPPQF